MKKKRETRVRHLLKRHAPRKATAEEIAVLAREVLAGDRHLMVVLSADIRQSTFAMKEAVDPLWFAQTLSQFVDIAEETVRGERGWFDKFTGDGFLAYWLVKESKRTERDLAKAMRRSTYVADDLMQLFADVVLPALRLNSQNMPAGIGLSIGIDAGPAYVAEMGADVTIVGEPVVGAVRMVSAAHPWECLANVFVGERLLRRRGRDDEVRDVCRERRSTKEYDDQEVYRLVLPAFDPPSDRTGCS